MEGKYALSLSKGRKFAMNHSQHQMHNTLAVHYKFWTGMRQTQQGTEARKSVLRNTSLLWYVKNISLLEHTSVVYGPSLKKTKGEV